MAKLYVFAIGGTGSRVLRPFTFLLAAGVKPKGFDEVVPVIIDADTRCGDKDLAVKALQDYFNVQKYVNSDPQNQQRNGMFMPAGTFFQTRIMPICQQGGSKSFLMNVFGRGVQDSFAKYMNFNNLDENTKNIVKLLFNEDNLKAKMDVGFKGNPNMGSVVLNGFGESADFQWLKQNFHKDDAIFIISSIFGGTGASGFPLLLNTINSSNNMKDAQVGAITVLPYFSADGIDKQKNNAGKLDTSTFMQKTKAALAYYADHIDKKLDCLYYIGDNKPPVYDNHDGGENQKNPPHFVEFAAALSVFHFAEHAMQSRSQNKNGNVKNTIYFEYGVEDVNVDGPDNINFSNLPKQSLDMVKKEMSSFLLAANFLKQKLDSSWDNSWVTMPESFEKIENSDFLKTLKSISSDYCHWLKGISEKDNRKFAPLQLSSTSDDVFDIVAGRKHFPSFKDKIFGTNYDKFTKYLDKAKKKERDLSIFRAAESKFLFVLNKVCLELYKEEIE